MDGAQGPAGDKSPSTGLNHMELFVRAGKDGESYGACPVCQRVFMILLAKAHVGALSFTVTTINMAKPPQDFKRFSSRLPVVTHGKEVLVDIDDIVQYIEDRFPTPEMCIDDDHAVEATKDVFSKFSFFIKDVSHTPKPLLDELSRMNDFMSRSPQRFLTHDELGHMDFLFLPKLQHIRVICAALKNFTFPAGLVGLWAYLKAAYSHSVFRQSCPSDQEIICHWLNKPELARLPKDKENQLLGGEPTYSFDVPKEVS